jgi:hypothetical protein
MVKLFLEKPLTISFDDNYYGLAILFLGMKISTCALTHAHTLSHTRSYSHILTHAHGLYMNIDSSFIHNKLYKALMFKIK